MIKLSISTITLFFFFIHNGCLLEAADKNKDGEEVTKIEGVYNNVAVNETLLKMMQVPGVKAIHTQCVKDNPRGVENIPTCIWDAVEKNPDQKKAIQAIYAAEEKANKAGRSPASVQTNLTGKVLPVQTNYSSDPAVQALSKYYGDKLNQILDPTKALTKEEQEAGKILSTDHKKFIELYESELGKTIINAFTSYCMDTDPDRCKKDSKHCLIFKDETQRKNSRKTNLDILKSSNLDLKTDSEQSNKWNQCILTVPKVCDLQVSNSDSDEGYSKQKACIIVDYVKAARKSLLVIDEQKKFYDDLEKKNGPGGGIAGNFHAITDPNKVSADSILSITSKDVEESLKTSTKETQKEFDDCIDSKSKNISNEEACKKFINTKTDTNLASLSELTLRQNLKGEALKEELASSNDKVISYLKEEGYKEDEIIKVTQDKDSLEKIKKQIMDRYDNQKDAIIKEMAERIKAKTSSEEGKINTTENKSKFKEIRDAIDSKGEELANLIQFNNIVSSYLTVKDKVDKTKKAERNTASLFAELKTMDKDQAKILQKQIDDAKLVNSKNSSDLSVEELNQMLKYDEMKKGEPKP